MKVGVVVEGGRERVRDGEDGSQCDGEERRTGAMEEGRPGGVGLVLGGWWVNRRLLAAGWPGWPGWRTGVVDSVGPRGTGRGARCIGA